MQHPTHEAWPALTLDEWHDTKEALHRYCQMIGKVRLPLAPFQNHGWQVTLHPTVDGLTTGMMPADDGRTLEVQLDLRTHAVRLRDSLAQAEGFVLQSRLACADFHDELMAALLEFFEDAYHAGATAAGWALTDLATRNAP